MNIVYSKPDCRYCVLAKAYLINKGINYTENIIGVDITREEFVEMFPDVKTVPFMIIEGQKVYGYGKLLELNNEKD